MKAQRMLRHFRSIQLAHFHIDSSPHLNSLRSKMDLRCEPEIWIWAKTMGDGMQVTLLGCASGGQAGYRLPH